MERISNVVLTKKNLTKERGSIKEYEFKRKDLFLRVTVDWEKEYCRIEHSQRLNPELRSKLDKVLDFFKAIEFKVSY